MITIVAGLDKLERYVYNIPNIRRKDTTMMSQGTAIALGLLLSFLIYSVIPVFIAFAISKIIQPSKYRNLCFLFNLVIVAVSWTITYSEGSSGTFSLVPYVLWTLIAVSIGKGILASRGKLAIDSPKAEATPSSVVPEHAPGPTMDETESLDDYVDGKPIDGHESSPDLKPARSVTSVVATRTPEPALIEPPAPKKKGKTVLVVVLVLFLLVGIVGWVYYSSYTHARAHALVGNFTKADQLLFARSITERHDPLLLKYEDAGLTALSGDYESAEKQFLALSLIGYEDSQRRVYWCRYEAARGKFDTDMASAYAEYQELVKVGFMSQESLDDITESIYQQGLTFYQKNNQKKAREYLNVITPYKRSDDYLAVLNKNDYNKLLNLIGFENAKEIIEEKYIMRYVSGDWETEDGRYFFMLTPAINARSIEKLETNISTTWYQLPLRVAGGSIFPDVSGEHQDIFTYEIIDANTMDLTSPAYKKTYTLHRKDKIVVEEPEQADPSISTWEKALPTTPAVSAEEKVVITEPTVSAPDVKSAAKDALDQKDGLKSDGKIHVYILGKGETISAKNSYSIKSMTYYEESDHLVINFGGKEYVFANVGSSLWDSFKAASSSDSYYDSHIKGNKSYWVNDYNGKNGNLIVMEYVDSDNQQFGFTSGIVAGAKKAFIQPSVPSYTPDYATCLVCGRAYSTDMMYDMGGDYICEGCLDSGDFATCVRCGNIYHEDEMNYFDEYLCENCVEKMSEEYDREYEDW